MSKFLGKALIGASVSLIIILIIMGLFNVKVSDLLVIGVYPSMLSVFFSGLVLLGKGLRFHFLINTYQRDYRVCLGRSLMVRIASEFVSLTSFSFIGDEALRVAWLSKKGVNTARALWIAYAEVFFEVIVGIALSLIGAVYLFLAKAYLMAFAVGTVSLIVLGINLAFIMYSKNGRIPDSISKILDYFLKGRDSKLIRWVRQTLVEFPEVIREVARREYRWKFIANILITIFTAFSAGASLNVLFKAAGVNVDLFTSTVAVYVAVALATLPVTIGGSGLMEAGLALFSASTLGFSPWNAILAWRVISYYFPLLICGLTLIYLIFTEGLK